MTLLHIITSLRTGGAERLVTDLLPRLREGGDDVALLLFDGTRTPLYDQAERAGIPVHALSSGWKAMWNPLLVFRLVRFLGRNRYEVVHTHNTSCQMLGAVASLFRKGLWVTTEHNVSNRRRSWKGFRLLDRWMYGRYRHIVCVGEETRRSLVSYLPVLEGKVGVIPNGVDLRRFRTAVPDPDISGTEGYKVMMTAAFRAQKDHATLIRAAGLLPASYRLFLAGGAETPEDRRTLRACQDLVRELGLEGRVCFLGVRSDIPALLSACDVVVLSSRHEGQSLSAIEGMASGKPFIASNVEGLGTMVAEAGLLFPLGDARSLADAIRALCGDPAFARDVARRCEERVRRYDIAETARRYRQLYENLRSKLR